MKKIVGVLKWLPSAFLALMMVVGGKSAFVFGLAALLTLPIPKMKELKQKIKIGPKLTALLAVILFFVGCSLAPAAEPANLPETGTVMSNEAPTELVSEEITTEAEITEESTEIETTVPVEAEIETTVEKTTEPETTAEIETAPATTQVTTTESVVETKPAYTYTTFEKQMYATKSVNVRNQPGTDGDKLGGLSTAQEVTVTGQCNETSWYRIIYKGGEAFVSSQYLSDEKPVIVAPTPKPTTEGAASGDSSTANYVINKNSKVFHYPTCRGVGNMKESNKVFYTGTRDELIGDYKPCGICNP